jgi:hypothetical protein
MVVRRGTWVPTTVLASAYTGTVSLGERGLSCLYRTDGFPFVVREARGGGGSLFKDHHTKVFEKMEYWNDNRQSRRASGVRKEGKSSEP